MLNLKPFVCFVLASITFSVLHWYDLTNTDLTVNSYTFIRKPLRDDGERPLKLRVIKTKPERKTESTDNLLSTHT